MYDWDFGIVWRHKWLFIQGAWVTVQITLLTIVIGTALGGVIGLARTCKSRWIRLPMSIYVELFLALPVLVLLIWIYFCGPLLLGISLSGFWTAVVALSLSLSAFAAEIVRSGILSVPKGQTEAARALGMSRVQSLLYISIPQAIRVMIPPFLGIYIACLKTTSLASTIAVYELLHSAQSLIVSSYRPLEIYTTVALIYVAMVLPISYITRRFESTQPWKLS